MTDEKRFHAKDFGAKGDGVTDDTEALQRAVDAAAEGGGTVELSGAHVLTGVVIKNCRVTGSRGEGIAVRGGD